MNLLSLEEIGTELDVYRNGEILCTILVINYEDIIEGTIGEYDDRFDTYSDYSAELTIRIKEHVRNPYDVSWYPIEADAELDLNDVASVTVGEGNRIVIIEELDETT
jgi:hypothetical protein